MQHVMLGTSGIAISEFVFGAGSIGGVGTSAVTRGKGISREEGLARLDEARAFGITLIDTADAYAGGESERVVGEWVKDRRPHDVLVSTKVGLVSRPDGSRGIDNSPEHIEMTLNQSLDRLGRVDILLSHAPDRTVPLELTLASFSEAQEAGRIKAYGVSNVDAEWLSEVLRTADRLNLHRPVLVENRLNLLDRTDETQVLPIVRSEGIGYTPFSPLAGGVLSERYLDGAAPDPASRIAVAGEMYYKGFYTQENLQRVAALREIAREAGIGVSALALGWLRDHPAVTAPIVAPSTQTQWDAIHEVSKVRVEGELRDRVSAIFG